MKNAENLKNRDDKNAKIKRDIPCCAADAMRRVKMTDIGGFVTGITMLDEICLEVKEMQISGREKTADELMKKIKIYNYVSESAYAKYREAVLREYESMK
ncbi:MAG: hypothetical protein PHV39_00095 [Methanomicrobium sp.]|nr:hypothetical protein [Methanomicrobium sp.]